MAVKSWKKIGRERLNMIRRKTLQSVRFKKQAILIIQKGVLDGMEFRKNA